MKSEVRDPRTKHTMIKGDLVARMGILDEVVWNKFYGSGGVEDVGNRE